MNNQDRERLQREALAAQRAHFEKLNEIDRLSLNLAQAQRDKNHALMYPKK